MEEQIDILMATYNSDIKYLKKQIDSILNQTYKNIKLIISDDNSNKKEVQEELKKYKEKDERIEIYIQEKNLGYTKNFGFLLERSTAEYIMFSDHDDIWYTIDKYKMEIINIKMCRNRMLTNIYKTSTRKNATIQKKCNGT